MLTLIFVLLIAGLVIPLLNLDGKMKQLIYVLVTLYVVLYIINLFHPVGFLPKL